MKNKKALQVMGMITLFPQAHNQLTWVKVPDEVGSVSAKQLATDPHCGTTMCFAGWTASMFAGKGALFVTDDQENIYVPDPDGEYLLSGNEMLDSDYYDAPKGAVFYRSVDINRFATETLGLTDSQSLWLFDADRTRNQLIAGIKHLMVNPKATSTDLDNHCEKLGFA